MEKLNELIEIYNMKKNEYLDCLWVGCDCVKCTRCENAKQKLDELQQHIELLNTEIKKQLGLNIIEIFQYTNI